MGSRKHRWKGAVRAGACCALGALLFALPFAAGGKALPASAAVSEAAAARNEDLVVRYALDETSTGAGQKLAATEWDSGSQTFVAKTAWDAKIQNHVNNADAGVVTPVAEGKSGGALSFTGKAHARATFHLPADATGMTISLWVKNITTYWGSLIEFWDGINGIQSGNGGRLGKGTMQGNAGRGPHDGKSGEDDPWSANCSAHAVATMAEGAGWDSFIVEHYNTNGDNGGAYVDNMKADTWYQVTYTVTETEMKAYRDGVLKQTFAGRDQVPTVLKSIMAAAKDQSLGQLGIRLAHDTTANRADILDELRIYNGAMTEDEVRDLYFEYEPSAELVYGLPEYVEATGIAYPEELLLAGAESVTDGPDGKKTGTTDSGVTYSYTPLTGTATPERDETGIVLDLTKGEAHNTAIVKFRRPLIGVQAEKLGYKVDGGSNVDIPVPEHAGDVVVKVPAGTDLGKIGAGDIAVKHFEGDDAAEHYKAEFSYDKETHVATVRCDYTPFPEHGVYYRLLFTEKGTGTFTSMTVKGSLGTATLAPGDFDAQKTAKVPVTSADDFDLEVEIALADGATAEKGAKYTYTESDLVSGKIEIQITNENGETERYYLQPEVRSADVALSALSAEGYSLNFEAGRTEFAVTLDKGKGEDFFQKLTATPAAAGAKAEKRYDRTANAVYVTVTAADGVNVRVYRIDLTELDTDARLASLTVGGREIEGFDAETADYTVKYKGDTAPQVGATAASSSANAAVGSPDGTGKVTVTVTAQNGAKRTYTVTLVKMSSAAQLEKFTLNGEELHFTDGTARYTAPAGVRLEDLLKTAKAEVSAGASAKVGFSSEEGKLDVTVTAEDGTVARYLVEVERGAVQFAEGTAEDNTPAPSGCGAAANGAEIAVLLAGVLFGAVLFVRKSRKNR